jgi:diacylglycerol kinase (ATP)
MKDDQKFSLRQRVKSFSFALEGIMVFFRTQHNAWMHVLASLVVIAAGLWLDVSWQSWCWLVACMAMVFVAEMLNTAIEFLCDHVSPEIHPSIKKVKDLSAAAVLFAAIAAVIIGILVFWPYVMIRISC